MEVDAVAVTQETFERVVLGDPERRWELHDGRLVEKPPMTFSHNRVIILLGAQLLGQIDLSRFDVRIGHGHVHRSAGSFYIPDLFVVPLERTIQPSAGADVVDFYPNPVLLVVEVWLPSTGGYDVDRKLPEYRARGDHEIWRLHPYERTLTAWRRQADGSYAESVHRGGTIEPVAVPGVTIDFDALFG
jgi:Uma2 family endonuclease